MAPRYVLGIDNGGTFTKAAIYDADGSIIALDQAHLDTLTPKPLFSERDIEEFWQANVRAIRRCLEASGIDPAEIAALAVTGHGNGLYLVDGQGRGVRPGIISTDGRAQSIVDEWMADPQFRTRMRAKTGSEIWAGQPPALLAWLEANEPDVWERTDYVLCAKDFIRFRLTGKAAIETTDCSAIGFLDVRSLRLDPDVFDFLGLTRWMGKIPELCGPADIAGYVTKEAAELTGLVEGTPVAGGVMDVAAGALAAGLVTENELCVITGTWSINEVISRELDTSEDVFLTMAYAVPDSWLILEASPNGVSNLDWFVRQVIRQTLERFGHEELNDGEVFEICERMILDFTPGEDDPFFVPYVNGTSVIPDGRAEFVGLTAFHDIRHIVRAVYEGVIFSHMYHIAKLREYTTLKGHVRFTGGAANSKIWTQMFADAIGAPVDVVDAAESGTLGTAICSAVAAGLYPDIHTAVESMTSAPRETVHPNPEFTDLFRRRYARFRRHIDVLAGNAAAGPADAPAPEASGPSASTPAPGEPEKKED